MERDRSWRRKQEFNHRKKKKKSFNKTKPGMKYRKILDEIQIEQLTTSELQ